MPSPATTRDLFFPLSAIATLFTAAAHYARTTWDMRRERRRQRKAIRELRGLDNTTLRDIGFDRSEITSVVKHGRQGR